MSNEGVDSVSSAVTALLVKGLAGFLAASGLALLCSNAERASAGEVVFEPSSAPYCNIPRILGVTTWIIAQLLPFLWGVFQPVVPFAAESSKLQSLLSILKIAVPGLPAMLCYFATRFVLKREPLPQNQATSALFCWLGIGLVEHFGPQPDSSVLVDGLEGLTKGRNGGARGPFLVYLVTWIFACANLCFSLSPKTSLRQSQNGMAQVLLCILLFSLAHLFFGLGSAGSGTTGWANEVVVFGILLLSTILSMLGFISAYDALVHKKVSLSIFWPLNTAGCALLVILQDHLFYHDLVWTPVGPSGMTSFTLGCAFLFGTVGMMLKDLTQSTRYKLVPDDGKDPSPDSPVDNSLPQRNVAASWQWISLLMCLIAYYEGVTQPLVQVAHSPILSMHKHPGDLTKSNFELIQYLYEKRMPFAALVVALCSAIIPAFKFTGTILVMMPPKIMSDDALHSLGTILSVMSPYQFADIFIALLLLAYINIDAIHGASGGAVHCIIRSGFLWFLGYCLASIALAQTLEQEPAASESKGYQPSGPSATPIPVLERSNTDPGKYDEVGGRVHAQPQGSAALNAWADLWLTPSHHSGSNPIAPDGGGEPPEGGPDAARVAADNLPILVIVFCFWVLCTAVMIITFVPLVEIQMRVEGIIVRVQAPPVMDLYTSLRLQSKALVYIIIVPVFVTPFLYFVSAVIRVAILLKQNMVCANCEYALYTFEQIIKPWVMGDVWAIAVSAFYLSVQEPHHTFVGLSARLPRIPIGFFACLGMGVSTYCIRSLAPPRPQPESAASPRQQPEPAASPRIFQYASQESIASSEVSCQDVCQRLPYRAVVVWILWFALLWEFGPSEPGEVNSLSELNTVLAETVPIANKLLSLHVPQAVGNCAALALHEEQISNSESVLLPSQVELVHVNISDCKGDAPLTSGAAMVPFGIHYFAVNIDVMWATGMNTIRINQITVVPRAPSKISSPYHWALNLQGMWTGVQVWARARIKENRVLDAYVCCNNPFHFQLQISAACTQEKAFFGNVEVDSLVLDSIEIKQELMLPQMKQNSAMITIDFANATGTITDALRDLIKNFLTGKGSGMMKSKQELRHEGSGDHSSTPAPHQRHFNITEMINKVVKYNGGHRCPHLPPTTTTTTVPVAYHSHGSFEDRRDNIFQ